MTITDMNITTADDLLALDDFKYGCVFGPAGSGKTYLIREAK